MPQLDVLTYFTQFVYLLLSFVGAYIFALNFLLPRVLGAIKLRQKLNSISQATSKLEHSDADGHNATLYAAHDNLLSANYYACSKLSKSWPTCAMILQMSLTLKLKKLFCNHNVRSYRY
jgi:Plant ATP synthase F0